MLGIGLTLGISYGIWLLTPHPVTHDPIYRSAQLPAWLLNHFVQSKHIQTIINLRGAHPSAHWYQKEIAIAQRYHVHHYDVALSSYQLPSPKQLDTLATLLTHAPKPMLIHCLSGADRAGFASAIAMILNGNASLSASTQQFSLAYLVTSKHSIGRLAFTHYTQWLITHHLTHSTAHFQRWIHSKHPF